MRRGKFKGCKAMVFVLALLIAQSGVPVFALDAGPGVDPAASPEQCVEKEMNDAGEGAATEEGDTEGRGEAVADAPVQDADAPAQDGEETAEKGEDPKEDGELPPVEVASYPAFYAEGSAYGMIVSVSAGEGVFPAGASLSVDEVPEDEAAAKDANAVGSYTFDIKVRDAQGLEIQPAGDKKVRISFTGEMVANGNLDTHVYHVDEELPASESGKTATAMTDGFSYYTVEFTYEDMQYVLKGGESVPLSVIMKAVGLQGEVSHVAVSNESLFSASKLAGQWIVTAKKAFSSTEWMRLTIDGIVYEICVTDDNFITYTGSYSLDQVAQGNLEDDYTQGIGAVNILIDNSVIYEGGGCRNSAIPELLTNKSEFVFYNPTSYVADNSVYLSIDVDEAIKNGRLDVTKGAPNYYDGPLVRYTFKDGAYNKNNNSQKYDVVITYSNLFVTFEQNNTDDEDLMLGICAGNMVGLGASCKDTYAKTSARQRYAITVDVNITVIDTKTKEAVPGSFYFPMVDLDVARGTDFGDFYDAANRHYYSEQLELKDGGYIGKLYIPGGSYDPTKPRDKDSNMPYLSKIIKTTDGILVSAEETYEWTGPTGNTRRNKDAYTGFATIARNTDGGLNMTYTGSSANLAGDAFRNGVDTHFLVGIPPVPLYTETYSYADSANLPADVLATLPTRDNTYQNGDRVTPASPQPTKVEVGKDTWIFLGWDTKAKTIASADVQFVGRWKKVTYTEHYSYSGNLPKEVLRTLPKRHGDYDNGTLVQAANPSAMEVAVKDGTWVFEGWDEQSKTIEGADVYFVGKWRKVSYTEHYSYSGDLPDEVLLTLPKRQGSYKNGAVVRPADPAVTEVTLNGGKWVFVGWDKEEATVDNADVNFVGRWKFVEDKAAGGDKRNSNTGDNAASPAGMALLSFASLFVMAVVRRRGGKKKAC